MWTVYIICIAEYNVELLHFYCVGNVTLLFSITQQQIDYDDNSVDFVYVVFQVQVLMVVCLFWIHCFHYNIIVLIM